MLSGLESTFFSLHVANHLGILHCWWYMWLWYLLFTLVKDQELTSSAECLPTVLSKITSILLLLWPLQCSAFLLGLQIKGNVLLGGFCLCEPSTPNPSVTCHSPFLSKLVFLGLGDGSVDDACCASMGLEFGFPVPTEQAVHVSVHL